MIFWVLGKPLCHSQGHRMKNGIRLYGLPLHMIPKGRPNAKRSLMIRRQYEKPQQRQEESREKAEVAVMKLLLQGYHRTTTRYPLQDRHRKRTYPLTPARIIQVHPGNLHIHQQSLLRVPIPCVLHRHPPPLQARLDCRPTRAAKSYCFNHYLVVSSKGLRKSHHHHHHHHQQEQKVKTMMIGCQYVPP